MPDTAIGRCVACWQTIVGIFCVAMLTAMFASSWELDPNEVSASAIEPLMLIPYSFPTSVHFLGELLLRTRATPVVRSPRRSDSDWQPTLACLIRSES